MFTTNHINQPAPRKLEFSSELSDFLGKFITKILMDRKGWPLLIALVICVNAKSFSNGPLIPYNIDTSQTTVSGLSSGGLHLFYFVFVFLTISSACMATQYHVAHSSQIRGAAIIAGCAYYCANANLPTALLCMDGAAVVPELVAATNYAALTLSIDSPSHMKDDLVWLFSGTSDSVVNSSTFTPSFFSFIF